MKKKTERKKLVLAKETVRALANLDLVRGGTTWQATCAGCNATNYNSCYRICQDDDSEGTCTCP